VKPVAVVVISIVALAGLLAAVYGAGAGAGSVSALGSLSCIAAVAVLARWVVGRAVPATQRRGASGELPESVEPQMVCETLHRRVQVVAQVNAVHLWGLDDGGKRLLQIAAVGSRRPGTEPVVVGDGVVGRVASGEGPLLERIERQSLEGSPQTVWRYAQPVGRGAVIGVAAADIVGQEPHTPPLAAAFEELGPFCEAAVSLVRAQRQAAVARDLIEASQVIAGTLDPDVIVRTLLVRSLALAGAQSGSVMLKRSDGDFEIVVARGLPDGVEEHTRVRPGDGIAGWVAATGRPLVVEDLQNTGERGRRHGVRSAVSLPIADDDGVIGVLNVGSAAYGAAASESQTASLETLCRISAIALRNASAQAATHDLSLETLKALALAMETKDPYSRGTTERIVELAEQLGSAMGLSESEQDALQVAALLHDIGMSAAGDVCAVVDRPLSTVEQSLLKTHPVIAADVLRQAPALRDSVPIVYHHHESYDGTGYVTGLKADAIPLGARVLAVADSFVAMTSSRPYRPAMTAEEALAEMSRLAGTQYDPEVVRALTEILGGQPQHSRDF